MKVSNMDIKITGKEYVTIVFYGGSEDFRKIFWIKWETICLKENDGLV